MNCRGLIKAIDACIEKADDSLADILDETGFIDPYDTVKEISTLEEKVAHALKEESAYFLESFGDEVDLESYVQNKWPDVMMNNALAGKLRLVFFEEFTEMMPDLVQHYVFKIDSELAVEQFTRRTTAWVETWSKELSELMQDTSHKQMEHLLTHAMSENKSVAEFTNMLIDSGVRGDYYNEYYRARRVALTEILRAHSYAQQEAILQNPAIEEKEWIHSGTYKNEPRENHVEMNEVRVPKAEPFVLKGADGAIYYPQVPRDTNLPASESINCHCHHRGIVSKEILGLSLEERKELQQKAIEEDDGKWEAELDQKNREWALQNP